MSLATGLLNKLNSALKKFTPFDRLVYSRSITRTSVDAIIGRGVTVSTTDTLFDPQPVFLRVDNITQQNLSKNGINVSVGDYEFLFSADAVSLVELQNKDFTVVVKDASGLEEVLRSIGWESASLNSTSVAFTVYMRSVKQ